MYRLSLFACIFLTVVAQYRDDSHQRIIHGTVVDIVDFPYQVALVARNRIIICGGALVKPNVVFTAAHCTHDRNDNERENLKVLVGANHLGDPDGTLHEIESVKKHPDFTYHELDNDFSVVVLKEPVQFNDKTKTIAVSDAEHDGGTVATISGWGRTETGRPSKYLRATRLTVAPQNMCQKYFPGVFHPRITDNMICVRPSRTSTYFGDSGGPLVVDGELVGLVSFGRRIGRSKKTTVFTRVKNFLDFAAEAAPGFSE